MTYNEQLQQLTDTILAMGRLVKEMIAVSFKAINARDDAHKEQVRILDRKVNELYRSINEQATTMLTFRSPMGDDLRFVASAFGIASDLEHAGDLAKNIGKRSLKVGDYTPAAMETFKQMEDLIISMFSEALVAIEKRDPEIAAEAWRRDKQVDDLYHMILKSLQEEMQKHPESVAAITHFILASKNFERIADYATGLARTVYFTTTGKQASKKTLKGN